MQEVGIADEDNVIVQDVGIADDDRVPFPDFGPDLGEDSPHQV